MHREFKDLKKRCGALIEENEGLRQLLEKVRPDNSCSEQVMSETTGPLNTSSPRQSSGQDEDRNHQTRALGDSLKRRFGSSGTESETHNKEAKLSDSASFADFCTSLMAKPARPLSSADFGSVSQGTETPSRDWTSASSACQSVKTPPDPARNFENPSFFKDLTSGAALFSGTHSGFQQLSCADFSNDISLTTIERPAGFTPKSMWIESPFTLNGAMTASETQHTCDSEQKAAHDGVSLVAAFMQAPDPPTYLPCLPGVLEEAASSLCRSSNVVELDEGLKEWRSAELNPTVAGRRGVIVPRLSLPN